MSVGFLAGLGAAVVMSGVTAFNVYCHINHRKYMKKERGRINRIEYNKTHPPSKDLPPLSPDWGEVGEFIEKTRFDFTDKGESYSYISYENHLIEHRSIPKSDFDGDTLKLIELLKRDVDWFYGCPTGNSAGERGNVLESFLREKYPQLSDKSISRIWNTYCINNR